MSDNNEAKNLIQVTLENGRINIVFSNDPTLLSKISLALRLADLHFDNMLIKSQLKKGQNKSIVQVPQGIINRLK